MINSEKDIIDFIKPDSDVYIYGAGANAKILYQRFLAHNIFVKGFIVTSEENNPAKLFSLPVIAIKNFNPSDKYIIFTTLVFEKIVENIPREYLKNICFIPIKIVLELKANGIKDLLVGKQNLKFIENSKCEINHGIFASAKNEHEYHWRIPYVTCEQNYFLTEEEIFHGVNILDEFEMTHGKYNIFTELNNNSESEKECRVYMARCHVDKDIYMEELPDWEIPIQVGAALTSKRFGTITDDIGDNISDKNANYCECTALYWAWKNDKDSDYIGLSHYRRHFFVPDNNINLLLNSDIDVLLTSPVFVRENVKNMFCEFLPFSETLYQIILFAIQKEAPEYYEYTEKFFSNRFYSPCNMSVMKREVFEDYCNFMFKITFEIEQFFSEKNIYMQNRYMGFIIECLLGIYVIKNKDKLKIAYTDMIFYDGK